MSEEFIEYRVRPVTRYYVTRYEQAQRSSGSEGRGEFDTYDTAYAVAYALAKAEHDRLGYPSGDMRIRYPLPATHPTDLDEVDRELIALPYSEAAAVRRVARASGDRATLARLDRLQVAVTA